MVKLIALYKRPSDVAAFEKAYWETHVPLVEQVPGLQKLVVNRVTGTPFGETDLYMIAELYFDNEAALKAGMSSPENQAAGKNLMSFAKGLVSVVFTEEKVGAAV